MNANAIALDALKPCPFCGNPLTLKVGRANPSGRCETEGCIAASLPVLNLDDPQRIAAWNRRAALEAEPQDTTVLVRLHRPEGYEDVHPELVMEDAHIHPDFRPELANGLGRAEPQGWRPISEAPKDGLFQDGNNHYAEYILAWHPAASLPYRARWWFRDDTGACNFLADGGYAVFPTVFQPLPTPPKD